MPREDISEVYSHSAMAMWRGIYPARSQALEPRGRAEAHPTNCCSEGQETILQELDLLRLFARALEAGEAVESIVVVNSWRPQDSHMARAARTCSTLHDILERVSTSTVRPAANCPGRRKRYNLGHEADEVRLAGWMRRAALVPRLGAMEDTLGLRGRKRARALERARSRLCGLQCGQSAVAHRHRKRAEGGPPRDPLRVSLGAAAIPHQQR